MMLKQERACLIFESPTFFYCFRSEKCCCSQKDYFPPSINVCLGSRSVRWSYVEEADEVLFLFLYNSCELFKVPNKNIGRKIHSTIIFSIPC